MYAHIILTIIRRAPLLAVPRLGRLVSNTLYAHHADAPGDLWAYAVQPCTVRLIVGPVDGHTLDAFVAQVKAWTETPLLHAIRQADDDTLDAVLHYSPVWGGAIFRVWEKGYHHVPLWNAYRLNQAVYTLGTLRERGVTVWMRETKSLGVQEGGGTTKETPPKER